MIPLGLFALFVSPLPGIWVVILTAIGYGFGTTTQGLGYGELIHQAKAVVDKHMIWIVAGCILLVAVYACIHRLAAGSGVKDP
jgi:hypothetical protein